MGKTDGHQRAVPLTACGQIELALDNQPTQTNATTPHQSQKINQRHHGSEGDPDRGASNCQTVALGYRM